MSVHLPDSIERVVTLAVVGHNAEVWRGIEQKYYLHAHAHERTPRYADDILRYFQETYGAKVLETSTMIPEKYALFEPKQNVWMTVGDVFDDLRKAKILAPTTVLPDIYHTETKWNDAVQFFGPKLIEHAGDIRHITVEGRPNERYFDQFIDGLWNDVEDAVNYRNSEQVRRAVECIRLLDPSAKDDPYLSDLYNYRSVSDVQEHRTDEHPSEEKKDIGEKPLDIIRAAGRGRMNGIEPPEPEEES